MPKKKIKPIEEEKEAELESEAMTHHNVEPSAEQATFDEEAEEALTTEEGVDADQVVPAEVAAISEENETAKELNEKITVKEEKPTQNPPAGGAKKKSRRSKRYQEVKELVELGKLYKINEAVELAKKTSIAKFDASIEVHLKLAAKKGKSQTESLRGVFHLPHGTGKTKKIIVLDEAKIEEIARTKKIDFDVAIATPDLMPKIAKIAKILGPKGKMPDPKSGTVTNDPKSAIEEINKGKIEYRIDSQNNVHQIIGKVSWEDEKIIDNLNAVFNNLPKSRLEAAYLTATIGPSVPLDLKSL